MTLIAEARSETGKIRSNNEDGYYINEEKGIFIIADGMGGHKAGEVASRIALESISSQLEHIGEDQDYLAMVTGAISKANISVFERSLEDLELSGMGTTVVTVLIHDNRLIVAHVGDSRAYLFLDGTLTRLTDDHSLTFQLVKSGTMTEAEARLHPRHGTLYRALGVDSTVEVDAREVPYHGETLLMCTDGLTDMVNEDEIARILSSGKAPDAVCRSLVDLANGYGGRDNITVIVAGKNETGRE